MNDDYQPTYQTESFTLSQVRARPIDYIWEGRMAAGMITLIDGDPGNGKTLMVMDIASRLTRGDSLPGETEGAEPASVLMFTAEDSLEQVVKPRFMAAGAVESRVGFIVKRHTGNNSVVPVSLPNDIQAIENVAQYMPNLRMIMFDPVMSYLSTEISSADDMQVRQALAPLTAMAERLGCAVVMIRHLNKNQGSSAMYRGGGSIAFIGAARFSFMAALHPDDPDRERRVLAPNKVNANKMPLAYTYTIENNEEYSQPVIRWDDQVEMHAENLVLEGKSEAEQNKLQDSIKWLRAAMRNGPVTPQDLFALGTKDGFERSEIKSAIDADGVRRKQNRNTLRWEYHYPPERHKQIADDKGFVELNSYE